MPKGSGGRPGSAGPSGGGGDIDSTYSTPGY